MRRTCIGLIATLLAGAAAAEVVVLDIDRAGADAVAALKQSPGVRAWAELGDTLVVDGDARFIHAQRERVLASLPVPGIEALASRAQVHCDGQEADHGKHRGDDVLFERAHWQLVPAFGKRADYEILRPGRVVAHQLGNRAAKQLATDADVAALLGEIQIATWRRNLQALSGFNRQSEAGYGAAANWLQAQFNALGLETSRQSFTVPETVPSSGRNFNVLGLQRGLGQGLLIVGAHLDSRNSSFNDQQPSPGAEDNASGCAAVLETARVLRDYRFEADILYICYGLEERGLYGGRAHAAAQTPSQILGVINMDMIAYDGDNRLDVSLQANAPGFGLQQRLADNAARYTDLEVELAFQTCCSDHRAYSDLGMSAVLVIENDYVTYPQYHTVDDVAANVSDTMAHEVMKMSLATTVEIARLRDGSRHSGYWYDPAQSGHGFQVELQDDNQVFLTWYTFAANGERLWVTAIGSVNGNTATLNAYEATGGSFPPAFDPTQVQVLPWGSFELTFNTCDRMHIRWLPNARTGLPAGEMNAVRSSDPLGGGCDDN